VGEEVAVFLGAGDYYPVSLIGSKVEAASARKRIRRLVLIEPSGEQREVELVQEEVVYQGYLLLARLSFAAVGSYTLVLYSAPYYQSKTAAGWVFASPEALAAEGVEASTSRCLFSVVKLVVCVGGGGGEGVSVPLGEGLEFVPLADPAKAKAGERFPLQLVYAGQPVADMLVYYKYGAPFWQMNTYPLAARTDESGRTWVRFKYAGCWAVVARYELPGEGKLRRVYKTSLIFEVKDGRVDNQR